MHGVGHGLPQGFDFASLGALFFVAALVAIVTQRLKLPYSVGLVAAGLVLALLKTGATPPLTRDLIFLVFLPPLIFEAAIQIRWRPLRREMPLLLVLVTLGVLIAAAVVAAGMHWGLGWSPLGAALFGVLIAATDPVSVIAAFKQLRVERRLHLLVEAESLLNDGVAAVAFAILASLAGGAPASVGGVALALAISIGGGILAGGVVTAALLLVNRGTDDRLVEVTISWLIAYGSFLLAERLGGSGVLATLTAGLIVGNRGFGGSITNAGRGSMLAHWEFVAFLINSVIFLLIGGEEAAVRIGAIVEAAALAVALSLIGRAAAVYPVIAAFSRSRFRVSAGYGHVLFWGGLRGALALALALALPVQIAERREIIAVAFAVVAFSIVVQGLTMPWLIDALRLRRPQGTRTVSTASGEVSGQSSV